MVTFCKSAKPWFETETLRQVRAVWMSDCRLETGSLESDSLEGSLDTHLWQGQGGQGEQAGWTGGDGRGGRNRIERREGWIIRESWEGWTGRESREGRTGRESSDGRNGVGMMGKARYCREGWCRLQAERV